MRNEAHPGRTDTVKDSMRDSGTIYLIEMLSTP